MEGFPKPKPTALEAPAEESGSKLYPLESGEQVEVSWHAFSPKETESSVESREDASQPTVVFLPGWSLAAGSESIRELATSFAERTHKPSISITSSSEKRGGEDYLYSEAQAIAQAIQEKGLTKIVLAGYSQGGDKAINIVELLKEDPGIEIEGVILIDSVGLYEQEPMDFTKKFAKDALINTPTNFVRSPNIIGRSMKVSTEILSKMLRDIGKEKTGYAQTLKNEVKGMAKANPRLSEISVPIVIVSGADDPISDPEKIMPQEHEDAIREARTEGEAYADPRETFLKENVFPHSPYIRMVKPTKLSNHGLPLFRSDSVAQASLYLLERYKRRQGSQAESEAPPNS